MDEFARHAMLERQAERDARRRVVWVHAIVWGAVNLLLFVIWAATGAGFPWFLFPLFGWFIGVAVHAASVYVLKSPEDVLLDRRRLPPS